MNLDTSEESISICFCAWNEQDNIITCIDDAIQFAEANFPDSYEIYVIDNASTDRTPEIVRQQSVKNPRVQLHRHDENRLYSGSYRSALGISKGRYIAILDGDYQHTCKDLEKALHLMKYENVDIIYGWKKERHDGLLRDVFSFGLKIVSQALIGHRLNDINCGFRLFKAQTTKNIRIQEKVNSVGPELYCEARRLNLKIGEIPVQHFARQEGAGIHGSLLPLLRGTKRFAAYLLRLRKRFGSTPVLTVSRA